MNHSLGALLALKNEEGFEQAIYYLRRTLNEAECRYNPVEKECLALVLAIQKTRITWLGNHPCHFKSQSPADPHDKAGIIVFQIGQLGHIIVSIWHDLCTSEGNQGSNSCRFSSSSSYLDNFKAAWRYPGRDHREANMTSNDGVWQMFFDGTSRTGSKGKIVIRVGVVFVSPNDHVLVLSH